MARFSGGKRSGSRNLFFSLVLVSYYPLRGEHFVQGTQRMNSSEIQDSDSKIIAINLDNRAFSFNFSLRLLY